VEDESSTGVDGKVVTLQDDVVLPVHSDGPAPTPLIVSIDITANEDISASSTSLMIEAPAGKAETAEAEEATAPDEMVATTESAETRPEASNDDSVTPVPDASEPQPCSESSAAPVACSSSLPEAAVRRDSDVYSFAGSIAGSGAGDMFGSSGSASRLPPGAADASGADASSSTAEAAAQSCAEMFIKEEHCHEVTDVVAKATDAAAKSDADHASVQTATPLHKAGMSECFDAPAETPREAAYRRKREAADREMARIAEATAQHMAVQPVRPRRTNAGSNASECLDTVPAEAESRTDAVPWAIDFSEDCASYAGINSPGVPSLPSPKVTSPKKILQEVDDAASLLAWSASREFGETPRQAAQRRKVEAADRDLAQLKMKQAEEAGTARRIGLHLREMHARSFHTPFATASMPAEIGGDKELTLGSPMSLSDTVSHNQSLADQSTTPGKWSTDDLITTHDEDCESDSGRLLELPGHSVLMAWQDDGCTLGS